MIPNSAFIVVIEVGYVCPTTGRDVQATASAEDLYVVQQFDPGPFDDGDTVWVQVQCECGHKHGVRLTPAED